MPNILTEFLGLDLLELKDTKENNEELSKKIAVDIVKLTEYPEWKTLEAELKRLEDNIDRPCEFYADRPNDAWVDVGMKRALAVIKHFIQKQNLIVEKYAKETEKN